VVFREALGVALTSITHSKANFTSIAKIIFS
jgi:hypothetical protein